LRLLAHEAPLLRRPQRLVPEGVNDALNAKGNFRFERELRRWRSEPALDMRRKR